MASAPATNSHIDDSTGSAAMRRLYDAALVVAGAHDVGEALQAIVETARELVGAGFSALGVPGLPGEPMAHFYTSGVPKAVVARLGSPPTGHGVLGLLLSPGEVIRMENIHDHPAAKGYPTGHPVIRSFLGLPIRAGGQIIGDLYLGNKIGAEVFSQDDQRLIEMLAAHAAVVIQNLRYQEQARQMGLLHEREQIARELQDTVLQVMYGSGLLLRMIDFNNPQQAAAQLHEAQVGLDAAIEHLRVHLLGLTVSQPPPSTSGNA